jgi:DNA-binding SARP family transcriptional activator
MLTFRLLGPVEVWSGPRLINPGQPRHCTLLAALLADAGQVISPDTLIGRVWGTAPPRSAHRSLQSHIARLRAVLAGAGDDDSGSSVIIRRSGGYLLAVDPARVDVHRSRQLRTQARDVRLSAQERVALLREAVALWRGEPLTGVPGDWAARTRGAWGQHYVEVMTAWALAEISVGRADCVVGPMEQLAADHPLTESVVAVQMRALHAAGRGAEALRPYDVMRRRLADELGADPSRDLQAVYQGVLRGALPAAPDAAEPDPTAPSPSLPPDLHSLAGRGDELARLDALLDAAHERHSGAMTVCVVSGAAGIGKTSLALHWAHRAAHRFPGGQLYVNLRGSDPNPAVVPVAELVRGFLDALGVPAERMPAGVEEQLALYRREMMG